MHRIIIVSVLALGACLPMRKGENAEEDTGRTRVCVRNSTSGYGSVSAHVGLARYDVMPGQTVCRDALETGGGTQMSARTMGGGANGPLTFRAALPGGSGGCWMWTLDNTARFDNIRPCYDGEDRAPGSTGGR